MKQHMRQHTGERPFSCPICNRTFVHRSNCYAHARKAHNKELAANPELAKLCKIANREGEQAITTNEMEMESTTTVLELEDGQNVKLEGHEIVDEGTTIMIVNDDGEKELITAGTDQEAVQIHELLLQQQADKTGQTEIQTIDGQTYHTIHADSATGENSLIMVPQYVTYTGEAGETVTIAEGGMVQGAGDVAEENIYTTTVADGDLIVQQGEQQADGTKSYFLINS